jgi:hypothetical protein
MSLGLRGIPFCKRREMRTEACVITRFATIDELTDLDRIKEPG